MKKVIIVCAGILMSTTVYSANFSIKVGNKVDDIVQYPRDKNYISEDVKNIGPAPSFSGNVIGYFGGIGFSGPSGVLLPNTSLSDGNNVFSIGQNLNKRENGEFSEIVLQIRDSSNNPVDESYYENIDLYFPDSKRHLWGGEGIYDSEYERYVWNYRSIGSAIQHGEENTQLVNVVVKKE